MFPHPDTHMELSEGMKKEVLGVIDDYVRFYNQKDAESILSLFSKYVSGFGTGNEEVITNLAGLRDRLREDFDPANSICLDIKILATGGGMAAAWVTAICMFGGKMAKKKIHREGRMTAVLVNHGGKWLFEQVHFSVPDAS
jgi:hypothetical protein